MGNFHVCLYVSSSDSTSIPSRVKSKIPSHYLFNNSCVNTFVVLEFGFTWCMFSMMCMATFPTISFSAVLFSKVSDLITQTLLCSTQPAAEEKTTSTWHPTLRHSQTITCWRWIDNPWGWRSSNQVSIQLAWRLRGVWYRPLKHRHRRERKHLLHCTCNFLRLFLQQDLGLLWWRCHWWWLVHEAEVHWCKWTDDLTIAYCDEGPHHDMGCPVLADGG